MCAVESEMISIFSCNDLLDFGVALARRLRLPFVLGLGEVTRRVGGAFSTPLPMSLKM